MKTFLSWSGDRSKQTALVLYDWLQQVLQAVEPWMSSEDIEKGSKWLEQILKELRTTKVGIICLNKDNINDAKWLVFEAGALSKTEDAYVCTFLLDITPADVTTPLSIFQHTLFEKDDFRKLLYTINSQIEASGGKKLDEKILDRIFDNNWDNLSQSLTKLKNAPKAKTEIKRSDRELIEEILGVVREINSSSTSTLISNFGSSSPHLINPFESLYPTHTLPTENIYTVPSWLNKKVDVSTSIPSSSNFDSFATSKKKLKIPRDPKEQK